MPQEKGDYVGLLGGEDFGEMGGGNIDALTMHHATKLHKASAVGRDQDFRAAFLETGNLVLGHRDRDMRKFDGEETAETATFLGIAKIDHLQARD